MTGIIKRFFAKKSKRAKTKTELSADAITNPQAAKVLSRDAHTVSRNKISKNALKVLYRLNEAGYQAYLVGGGVRDILLGLQPKDFDVATDATPEQIQAVFRNCRLIGRRFRLAHILFGREVIEVATFRAGHSDSNPPSKQNKKKNERSRTSDHGMLMRDNVYGSIIEDAFRRDFTVNALYYTVKDFSVLDYTGGLDDLAERKIKLIGDPEERYREDPVRILRAIRLACKLNLSIAESTQKPIKPLSQLLTHVSSARLWDECNKMLLAGHAETTWNALLDQGVSQFLFPQTADALKGQDASAQAFALFIQSALRNTDKRISNQQPVTPAFLFAVFLWKPVQELTDKLIKKGKPPYEASQKAASQVMEKQRAVTAIPKRFSMVAKEIWSLQHRLFNRRKKSVLSLIAHARFRAAYDFLCLRAGTDEQLLELAKWWTDYQEVDPAGRQKMIAVVEPASKKKRRRNSIKKSSPAKPYANKSEQSNS
jgi:poly(A) polymerase